MNVWHEIDERVLAWLAHEAPPSMPRWSLTLTKDEPSEEIPGLSNRQVDDSLKRLEEHDLVDHRGRGATFGGSVRYESPRLTGLGHRVLGVWPDLDSVSAVAAVQFALQTVAEDVEPESAPIVRRAIGVVGELSDAIISTVLGEEVAKLGGEE
jgi:hypothetical protein